MNGFGAGWRYFWSAFDADFWAAAGFMTGLCVFSAVGDIAYALIKWGLS